MNGLKIANYLRALRLAFVLVSISPFIFGSFLNSADFSSRNFFFGLICVIFTHLGANLINDYSDSKSKADWQDRNFYGFFGGSKLIQEGIFTEKFYLKTGIFCFSVATLSVLILAVFFNNLTIIALYFLVLFLGFSYSHGPLRFSYRKLGELIIFILFGPALVMGGYFLQTQVFPTLKSFLLSLPFGFFTVAVLFANEIPDYSDDLKVGKLTMVSLVGAEKSFILYYFIVSFGFLSILLNIMLGYLNAFAFLSLVSVIFAIRVALILKKYYHDKKRLVISSKMNIAIHIVISIFLILSIIV